MPTSERVRRRSPAPVSQPLQRLGERLRKARVEAGLSQAKLGAPHFTRAYVSALELGKIRPAMRSLEFLAARLGKPASYFLDDEEQEKRRRERGVVIARARQLIAEGEAARAIAELDAIDLTGVPTTERLALKRTLARGHLEAGGAAKSAALLTECLQGYRTIGDAEQVARTQAQLGAALVGLMSYAEAEEHLGAALRASAAGTVRDPLFRLHVLHNLGAALYQRGDYQAALAHFDRAAEEGQDVGDQKWLASVYAAMGMSHREVGDFERAISCLRKSEALFEAIRNSSRVAEIRFQLARTLRAVGNKAKAAAVAREAVVAAERAGNEALAIRIEAYVALCSSEDGKTEEAISSLESLIERAESLGALEPTFAVRFALGKSLASVEPGRAEMIFRDLAAERQSAGPSDDLAELYHEIGRLQASQGRSEEAVRYAQLAYETSQRAKKGGG